jgi:hypothetical protein
MTVFDKFVRNMVVFFVGGFVIGMLMLYISPWFITFFFLFVIVSNYYSMNLRCPNCQKRALYDFIPWIPQKCKHCGFSFVDEDVKTEEKK